MNSKMTFIKGESKTYKFRRKTKSNKTIKWLPDEMYITLKNNYDNNDYVWQKRLSTGDISYNKVNNYYSFTVSNQDTGMLYPGTYVLDISYKLNNIVKTIYITDINVILNDEYVDVDWTKSMTQSFEYYEVDPYTWKDKTRIDNIKSATIDRDLEAQTLGSASIDINDFVGECYIRIYMLINQNGNSYKIPLGIFLVQTPSSDYDGLVRTVSMDAYTPLLELKESMMPLGYSLLKGSNILESAYNLIKDNCRAPIVKSSLDKTLFSNFVSDVEDNNLSFVTDLLAKINYRLDLDELGRILFAPKQPIDKLQPVWTFNDDNSSILHPNIRLKHDLYGIPNKVEVISNVDNQIYIATATNEDINSPTSVPNRGRIILHREVDPRLPGLVTKTQLDEYAESLLKSLSSVEYQISYTHGYCPVRIGDCVRLNYERAGINNVKAKIISQSIKCDIGCSVSETAVFTKKLWK